MITQRVHHFHRLLDTLGPGGVFAEALDDVVMVPVPSTPEWVTRQLPTSTLGRILAGPRWASAVLIDDLADVPMRMHELARAAAGQLAAIDSNPLWIGAGTVLVLDRLVVPTAAPAPAHEPRAGMEK